MTPGQAHERALAMKGHIDSLAELFAKAQQEITSEEITEPNPILELQKVMQDESTGAHKAVGLMLAAVIGLRYHRFEITQTEWDSAKPDLLGTAGDLTMIRRKRKVKSDG